jgi:hypothetical protein
MKTEIPAEAGGTETPLSSEGMFLYLRPTYTLLGCSDAGSGGGGASSHYALRTGRVVGCEAFAAITTPATPEDCTPEASRGCTLASSPSSSSSSKQPHRFQCPLRGSCLDDLLEAVDATFDVDPDGVVSGLTLGLKEEDRGAAAGTTVSAEQGQAAAPSS